MHDLQTDCKQAIRDDCCTADECISIIALVKIIGAADRLYSHQQLLRCGSRCSLLAFNAASSSGRGNTCQQRMEAMSVTQKAGFDVQFTNSVHVAHATIKVCRLTLDTIPSRQLSYISLWCSKGSGPRTQWHPSTGHTL
eukprot:357281-Chlamydomonas_euryale.AAC.30